ncbi:hypothetical protein O181_042863 [Austropuccinia psidii MF-1]|uniref:dihydroorotase n=1 Tax=Austropuccinia psidii MF-1 TaxID=1389203 RepID=A0A9Q3DK70_9BASI|nr:hypothetical protein [Austropuccinia psidii MF-1]
MSGNTDSITVKCPFDAHVHLRQPGQLMELVVGQIAAGGIQSVYVMPNTIPPLTTVDMAVQYREALEQLEPSIQFFVSLYLSPSLAPGEIVKAKAHGIVGVKSYPRGVTTNSAEGVESYEPYYPVFEAMEREDLILNLHGELPSTGVDDTCIWNAEAKFLPRLHELHRRFPRLRIILEHATTRAAVEAVKACGPTVACTITAHHLALTIDDWAGNGLNYCKPVAKLPDDREALREVIRQGHPRFFLGSDSAPHPIHKKLPNFVGGCCAAGVYTAARLLPTLASVFESAVPPPVAQDNKRPIHSPISLDKLPDFASTFGRAFYRISAPSSPRTVTVARAPSAKIEESFTAYDEKNEIVPFWAGRTIGWQIL